MKKLKYGRINVPEIDPDDVERYADGYLPDGTPTYSGYTAEELRPQERTYTVEELVEGLAKRGLRDYAERAEAMRRAGNDLSLEHEYRMLSIRDLKVDQGTYQRLVNEASVEEILEDFIPHAVHPPIVVRRKYKDNELVIADAQQRSVAVWLKGVSEIGCVIYNVRTPEEETVLFAASNKSKPIGTQTKHKNAVFLQSPRDLAMEGAVRRAGFITGEKEGRRTVQGIKKLHKVAEIYQLDYRYNYALITKALLAYDRIWPDHNLVHTYIVAGLALLIHAYTEFPGYPTGAMKNGMDVTDKLDPSNLIRIATIREHSRDFPHDFTDPRKLANSSSASRPREQDVIALDSYYATLLQKAYNNAKGSGGSAALKAGVVARTVAILTSA